MTTLPYIHCVVGYNSRLTADGYAICDVYNTEFHNYVDIRQQEWPTHPKFWNN